MILFGLVVALSASCVLICTKILTELLWPFCISKETWPLAMHHRFSSYQLFPPSSSLFPNQTPSLFATLPSPQPLLHIGNLNCSSQPSMVHWLSSSIFPCLVVWLSRYGNTLQNLTSSCPTPLNPYIFWKLMIVAIQKWIRNTNTKTKTNTKTMTKTMTPRE